MYYHGDFLDRAGRSVSVSITTGGNSFNVVEIGGDRICFADDPVEITGELNDSFDVLLTHSASIRLLVRGYEPELFQSEPRGAVVLIRRAGTCLFAGFVLTQSYDQSYNEVWDELELSCVDALSLMQEYKYANIGAAGVDYAAIKRAAVQKTFAEILSNLLTPFAQTLRRAGADAPRFFYDGSRAIGEAMDAYSVFEQLAISELLFLEDEEDEVWTQGETLEELLRFLNLHIEQVGTDFYIFSWETMRSGAETSWREIFTGATIATQHPLVAITSANVADLDTRITIGETFSQLELTCDVKSVESLIESPFDDKALTSPYSSKQLYMRELSATGEGISACNALADMINGKHVRYTEDYEHTKATSRDWYVQVKANPRWRFPILGAPGTDYVTQYCGIGHPQTELLDVLCPATPRGRIGAALLSFGKADREVYGKDDTPVAKVDMSDCLFIALNGRGKGDDKGSDVFPDVEADIKAAIPLAEYVGNAAGGVLSPADNDTTNYIVFSGDMVLNPIYRASVDAWSFTGRVAPVSDYEMQKAAMYTTVYSRDNEKGRLYSLLFYYTSSQRITPSPVPVVNPLTDDSPARIIPRKLVPFTDTGAKALSYNYSEIVDGNYDEEEKGYAKRDTVSKVGLLACMLIVGDKCVVEQERSDGDPAYVWQTYKERAECADDDEYYRQSFTLGINPKIGDNILGTSFPIANNVTIAMGIDVEGTAIPIRKSDAVSGAVRFYILGPVNAFWGDTTRRHRTWFRSVKFSTEYVQLLSVASSLVINKFEAKLYSDNGQLQSKADSDIVYLSDTGSGHVNKKDDLTFRISSQLTAQECYQLEVPQSLNLSTPVAVCTNTGLTEIYNAATGEAGKAEQHYVDSYYKEYSAPRVVLEQTLIDTGGDVSRFARYTHPALEGKTFYVQAITRNLRDAEARLQLKEIPSDD